MDRSTLGLRLVADAIPTSYSRHDKALRLSKLIGTIVGDRNSIVSTPTGRGLGQLVLLRAERAIPPIFMRVRHIPQRGRPICPSRTDSRTQSKPLILRRLNDSASWNSTCT